MMWWLLDGQPFFQIELFAHTEPTPKPKPNGWLPSDLGWVRLGIAVPTFEAVEKALAARSVSLIGRHEDADGVRRISFIDPTTTALMEVIEAKALDRPAVRYATYSTADLDTSRAFYGEVLGLPIVDRDGLHGAEHEALWGLPDAALDGFLVDSGGIQIEIVQYRQPSPHPKPADTCIADLGIMNVALGASDETVVRQAIARVQAAGYATTPLFGDGGSVVTYVTDPGSEIELIAVPDSAAAFWGFHPITPFLGLSG